MMDMRSIDIINIVSHDDNIRKKEKKQFTRKAKLIRKLSNIKLRFGSININKNITKTDNDIENKNFLSNSSFSASDCDTNHDTGNESNASTQSTNTDLDTDNIDNTMIIYPYNNGLQNGTDSANINGIRK